MNFFPQGGVKLWISVENFPAILRTKPAVLLGIPFIRRRLAYISLRRVLIDLIFNFSTIVIAFLLPQ